MKTKRSKKMSVNSRSEKEGKVVSMLKRTRPDIYEEMELAVRRNEAEQAKSKIPKAKLARMKKKFKALEAGETLEISYEKVFTMRVPVYMDNQEPRVDEANTQFIPPSPGSVTKKNLLAILRTLVRDLESAFLAEDGWGSHLYEFITESKEFAGFADKIDDFWEEVSHLEDEYQDFDEAYLYC